MRENDFDSRKHNHDKKKRPPKLRPLALFSKGALITIGIPSEKLHGRSKALKLLRAEHLRVRLTLTRAHGKKHRLSLTLNRNLIGSRTIGTIKLKNGAAFPFRESSQIPQGFRIPHLVDRCRTAGQSSASTMMSGNASTGWLKAKSAATIATWPQKQPNG